MLKGVGYQHLWPHSIYWHNEGFHLVYLLLVMAALAYSRRLLDPARLAPLRCNWMWLP